MKQERFSYQTGVGYHAGKGECEECGDVVETRDDAPGFFVFDRRRGHACGAELAFCSDRDAAEAIVNALNRLERLIEARP